MNEAAPSHTLLSFSVYKYFELFFHSNYEKNYSDLLKDIFAGRTTDGFPFLEIKIYIKYAKV